MKFGLFALCGFTVFTAGIVTRRKRWQLWSYLLTAAGLLYFWLVYGKPERREAVQWLGIACIAAEQQFGRRWLHRDRDGSRHAVLLPRAVQGTMIACAVCTAWVAWTDLAAASFDGGFTLAASWSIYAAAVFGIGLALRERVYRWLAMLVLAATLAHVVLVDIWVLDGLERFFTLLCLGIILMAIGFLYTKFHERMRGMF